MKHFLIQTLFNWQIFRINIFWWNFSTNTSLQLQRPLLLKKLSVYITIICCFDTFPNYPSLPFIHFYFLLIDMTLLWNQSEKPKRGGYEDINKYPYSHSVAALQLVLTCYYILNILSKTWTTDLLWVLETAESEATR